MEETTEIKPSKPFASLAQLKRCDNLVTEGAIQKELFERDLLATDVENIPWRKGPLKEEDPDAEVQEQYRTIVLARKGALADAPKIGTMTDDELRTIAANLYRPDRLQASNELIRRYPSYEGLQDGGEGLEAGRVL